MSRSNPRATNPSQRYFQWGGAEGKVSYWDKEAEDRIEVPFSEKKPFTFIVLDELNRVAGFSKADNGSIFSNEVRDMSKTEFTVRTAKGIKVRGTYNAIKGDLAKLGGKYAKSVYIAYKNDEGELTIGNILLMGAALSAWIDFNKKWDVYKVAVKLTGVTAEKNGTTDYFVPVFEGQAVSASTNNEAKALDATLQNFLSVSLNRKADDDEEIVEDDEPAVEEAATSVKKERKEPAPADDELDISEVPF